MITIISPWWLLWSTHALRDKACYHHRTGRSGLADQVLARPVFLKVKTIHKNQVVNKSASGIIGLVRFIISSYDR